MTGSLYVVGTPIGNLSDFSPRAKETLESVDLIAAEDTRVTLKLLNHFEIKKPMISYHEHNIREKSDYIVSKILEGQNVAIVTDAGMPCISDPGEDLVRVCAEHGVKTFVVPGPTAAMSALAISGLNTTRFSFEGFLTVRKGGRLELLNKIKEDDRTLIFYEAPHKLLRTLKDLLNVFGDRKIALCREITKIHEEVIRTTLKEAVSYYKEVLPKGEFVLIVEGYIPPKTDEENTLDEAIDRARELYKGGLPLSIAAKQAASEFGFKKGEIYSRVLEETEDDDEDDDDEIE